MFFFAYFLGSLDILLRVVLLFSLGTVQCTVYWRDLFFPIERLCCPTLENKPKLEHEASAMF